MQIFRQVMKAMSTGIFLMCVYMLWCSASVVSDVTRTEPFSVQM